MFRLIDAYRAVKQCHFVLYSTGYALAKLELHPRFHVKVDETESSVFNGFYSLQRVYSRCLKAENPTVVSFSYKHTRSQLNKKQNAISGVNFWAVQSISKR